MPRLDRLWKPANRCCAIISRHPGVTASRSQATQAVDRGQASWQRPALVAMPLSQATRDNIPLTMPVPGLRRGRGVSERPATPSTDSTPAIGVHRNVQVEPFAPSCGLQPRQLCCDWSPARINQAECWSGRHYVGTARCAPPDQDIPARRISSAWRPTYTLARLATCYGTCTPTYRRPHHHHPRALEFPSIETANKSLAGPHPLPLTYKYPSHHLMISNANLLHTIVVLLPHPTPSKFSSRGFLVRHGQHHTGCPV